MQAPAWLLLRPIDKKNVHVYVDLIKINKGIHVLKKITAFVVILITTSMLCERKKTSVKLVYAYAFLIYVQK